MSVRIGVTTIALLFASCTGGSGETPVPEPGGADKAPAAETAITRPTPAACIAPTSSRAEADARSGGEISADQGLTVDRRRTPRLDRTAS